MADPKRSLPPPDQQTVLNPTPSVRTPQLNRDTVQLKLDELKDSDQILFSQTSTQGFTPGDSGGPLFVLDKNNLPIQLGINAGFSSANETGYATNISQHKLFIEYLMKANGQDPSQLQWVETF